eukprot:gene27818-65664_t
MRKYDDALPGLVEDRLSFLQDMADLDAIVVPKLVDFYATVGQPRATDVVQETWSRFRWRPHDFVAAAAKKYPPEQLHLLNFLVTAAWTPPGVARERRWQQEDEELRREEERQQQQAA